MLLCEGVGNKADPSNETGLGQSSATWGPQYMFGSGGKLDTGYMGGRPGVFGNDNQPTGRHSDGSNFLLCDGHVKWLRPVQVSDGAVAYHNNAVSPTQAESNNGGGNYTAAGTGCSANCYDGNAAGTFVATFSPI